EVAPDAAGVFEAKGNAQEIPLMLQRELSQQADVVLLEKSWLQTWIVDRRRQDRAVFQFRPLGRNMMVDLPRPMSLQEIEVLLDGQPVEAEMPSAQRLVVPVSAGGPVTSRTLELRYQQSELLSNGVQ